jgi:hypothetical protein
MVYADTEERSDIQAQVKNWITEKRNNGISVSRKITIFFKQGYGWSNMELQNLLESFFGVTDVRGLFKKYRTLIFPA